MTKDSLGLTDEDRFNILRNKQGVRIERTVSKRTQEIDLYLGGYRVASKLIVYRYGKAQKPLYAINDLGYTESNP